MTTPAAARALSPLFPLCCLLSAALCAPGCEPRAPVAPAALGAPPAQVAAPPIPEGKPIVRKASGAPMSLTATDGTGLRLVTLTGKAVVEDPLAFTELRLVFENPGERTLEGTFAITLPQGAQVSRFAMRQESGWQEGEVVEKQAARRAYEDFLHRKQDPALLEQGAGNEFTARVFPIPARGRKELILSYSQEISSAAGYALPLQGLPEIEQLDVALFEGGDGRPAQALRRAAFVPTGDFGVAGAELGARGGGLRSGELVVTRVRPVAEARPDPVGSAVILFDTSASRALGFEAELELLRRLVQRIAGTAGPKASVAIAAFDQTTEPIFQGEAGSFGEAEIGRLRARQALGATDLARALAWSADEARAHGERRVILLTDGVSTAGETEGARLGAAALKLKDAGVERLDALAVGGIRDDAALRRLATIGLPRDGVVLDGALDLQEIGRRLGETTRSGLEVKVEGARWSWPTRLDGVQSGDEVLVYAEVPDKAQVRLSVAGAAEAPELRPVDRPLLERSLARARIESLLEQQSARGASPELQKQIVELSVKHRVLSPYTSLLVLETDKDYERFHVDRAAVADILSVDGGRLTLVGRGNQGVAAPAPLPSATAAASPSASAAPARRGVQDKEPDKAGGLLPDVASAPPDGDAPLSTSKDTGESFGAGGLGLSGIGEGGGGTGEGIGLGSIGSVGRGNGAGSGQGSMASGRVIRPPVIREGATSVNGRLPPEVIQRIVRQNFGRFRLCYENGLRRNPNLRGRVAVRFVIDRAGSVSAASDGGSDLPDGAVVACIVRGMTNLSFPQPEGGIVTVVYPITFGPGGAVSLPDPGASPGRPSRPSPPARPEPPEPDRPAVADPYSGHMKAVMEALARGDTKVALSLASEWHAKAPGDVLSLVSLGEALEASGDLGTAARAYGSLIDLFSSRADMRRFAGERLERIKDKAALALSVDTYEKAKAERPDHPSSHRLLAFAWLKQGEHEKAFEAEALGLKRGYPSGRFPGVGRIMSEDLGLIAAAWMKSEPARREEIRRRLKEAGGTEENGPSVRFVLTWETDANDVDFHIYDARGGHAFFGQRKLASGGELYADVTTGYGPECFTIRRPTGARSAPYVLQANYYSRGPMGYGMGKLEVIDHDGRGGLTFEEHPYVVMTDQAFVDLGVIKK